MIYLLITLLFLAVAGNVLLFRTTKRLKAEVIKHIEQYAILSDQKAKQESATRKYIGKLSNTINEQKKHIASIEQDISKQRTKMEKRAQIATRNVINYTRQK